MKPIRFEPTAAGIAAAAQVLADGGLLGLPTETVYGLAADAASPEAVARIYAAKGRPANHPIIVHLPPDGDPLWWAARLDATARSLIDAFWPGPLTLIVPRADRVPASVSGGQDSIGLRCPSHPVAQALLSAFSRLRGGHGGVGAPSANRFGKVSPTTAQHVIDEFDATVPVLDGGDSVVGIESTIVDLSRGFPALLRPGHVTREQIAAVLGEMPYLPGEFPGRAPTAAVAPLSPAPAPRASGTLRAHYAPRTPVALIATDAWMAAALMGANGERSVFITHDADVVARLRAHAPCRVTNPALPELRELPDLRLTPRTDAWPLTIVKMGDSPDDYARVLYGLLRDLDQLNVDKLVFHMLPDEERWRAVRDRLGRAAAAFSPETESRPQAKAP